MSALMETYLTFHNAKQNVFTQFYKCKTHLIRDLKPSIVPPVTGYLIEITHRRPDSNCSVMEHFDWRCPESSCSVRFVTYREKKRLLFF
jgi:hypothetical protein